MFLFSKILNNFVLIFKNGKLMGDFKDKVVSLFKTNTPKDFGKETLNGSGNRLSKLRIQKQSEDNIIKSIRNLFILKIENEVIKDRIIRVLRTLFEQEDDFYKGLRVGNFWNSNYIECESNVDRNNKPLGTNGLPEKK